MTKPDDTQGETIADLMARLGQGAEALASSDAWQAMLRVRAKMHRYSINNQILMWCQRPDVTMVAGYRKWQSLGRQVKKGEHGMKIYAPRIGKDADTGEKKVRGFGLATVFDISQTEGDEIPTVEWPTAGSCPAGTWDRLLKTIGQVHTIEVIPQPRPEEMFSEHAGARGWYRPDTGVITVRRQTEAGMCSTLLHELGHACDPDLNMLDRQANEFVAESVAYVLGLPLGVDVEAEAFHYIASWRGEAKDLLALAERVGKASAVARQIIDAEDTIEEAA